VRAGAAELLPVENVSSEKKVKETPRKTVTFIAPEKDKKLVE